MIREIGGRMIVQNYLRELCHYPLLDGEEHGLRAEVGRRMPAGPHEQPGPIPIEKRRPATAHRK